MRTSAEEGRYRSTQPKEVRVVAFFAYALVAVALSISRVILSWAVPL